MGNMDKGRADIVVRRMATQTDDEGGADGKGD